MKAILCMCYRGFEAALVMGGVVSISNVLTQYCVDVFPIKIGHPSIKD